MRWLTDERRQRFEGLFERFRHWLPWISLVLGVGGAFLMERTPDKAWMVATSAVVMWVLLGTFAFLGGLDTEQLEGKKAVFAKVFSFSALVGSQSLVQICLFFALPFYWDAATMFSGHAVFFLLLSVACLLTLWDPVYEFVFRSRVASAALLAFATFAGLNCILPIMGLSNRVSLYGSAVLTSVTIPVLVRLYNLRFDAKWQRLLLDVGGVTLFPLLIVIGGGTFVPPAPLEMGDAAMGTSVGDKWVADPVEVLKGAPAQLVCATAIVAPRGLKDELFHVWEKNGVHVDRVALTIRGGRDEGFRTWSIKKHLGEAPYGEWRCTVQTASGQTVGRTSLAIEQ